LKSKIYVLLNLMLMKNNQSLFNQVEMLSLPKNMNGTYKIKKE